MQDRLQHLFAIGQTGTGKSTLLRVLIEQDVAAGRGVMLIDPHGDLALALHHSLQRSHHYWDPADPGCRLGYNPLTPAGPAIRPLITGGLIDALKKQWADAWGARMEHLLRYAVLALLESPAPDLRDIMRLYLEKDFREQVLSCVTDLQVLSFWRGEFRAMNYTNAVDGVAPIANKLGAFLAHPLVRRSVCEPDQPLRLRQVMDRGETLIINLGKGRLGIDSATVLGGLILASAMHAGLSRQVLAETARCPFMLYVDEFHSFTTEAFADLLSEIRKYGIAVTLAQQYLGQSEEAVFAAIMGNVGSVLAFRVGPLDTALLSRQLTDIPPRDLIYQPNYRAFARLLVSGMPRVPFTLDTLTPGADWSHAPNVPDERDFVD
ncbi:type IV secretory system conjugative DNA transfer family protein [Gymnodinialimonas ceratoperidinii]|uniref:DUF87 domain-containing protein n=1 Tax=Gymnodinialimonas ceratoperidinii TaxID=2856823 RepID=A0A8F6TYJ2_9RHOB|nr:DUF87 domain-containing protein [Gymnodinialimonas ceratoperidinii]QXT41030.1 DUF87 domain-containing protein [Gymnodinialimonas ceratoperidinii]